MFAETRPFFPKRNLQSLNIYDDPKVSNIQIIVNIFIT